MKGKIWLMVLGLLVISLAANLWWWRKNREDMKVVHVLDGDTFTLKMGVKVRLLGANAPEFNACLGQEASKQLEELILGKTVTLKNEKWDQWGRKMALVYVSGRSIDVEMVRAGLAKAEYPDAKVNELLKQVQAEARERKIGIFGPECNQKFNTEKIDCQIKGNFDRSNWTKNYYILGCPHYDTVKVNLAEGDMWFCNEKEATQAGFILANVCK